MHLQLVLLSFLFSTAAMASGKIGYGTSAGMQVTVVSMSGLDTRNATIRTSHNRDDAVAFCRDYVQKVTEKCIQEELAVPLNDSISANCLSGEFTDFSGHRHRYAGPIKSNPDFMAHNKILDLATGEIEDGSNASGYPVNLDIFRALCPRHAPPGDD
jgi:hypothetical protein